MAAATPLCVHSFPETHLHAPQSTSVKTLAESPGLTCIPPNYTYTTNPHESAASEPEDSIPIIDFSSLTSSDPDQRSQVIQDLGKACQEWGFFMVTNIWSSQVHKFDFNSHFIFSMPCLCVWLIRWLTMVCRRA
ncbi:hypothetical protein CsSME_00009984 [Camellia sinensis var. sinensis]